MRNRRLLTLVLMTTILLACNFPMFAPPRATPTAVSAGPGPALTPSNTPSVVLPSPTAAVDCRHVVPRPWQPRPVHRR